MRVLARERHFDRRSGELHIPAHGGVPRCAIVGRGLEFVAVRAGMGKPKRDGRQDVDSLKSLSHHCGPEASDLADQ